MNTNDKNTETRNQPQQDDKNRNDEQFWAEWWREYAQTWK